MNNFEKIKACRSVASKEQTNDSLKNQDKNFNEKFTQEKEQIIIDGEKEDCKILFRCKHIDDLKAYIMICNGIKITPENAPISDSELILIENTDSPFGFSFLCKRNNKEDVWEYSGFGHSGACSIVTALFKQLDHKTQECEELKERLDRTEEDLKYQCVDCMNVKSDRYRKALEEIEKELKEYIFCESKECGCYDFLECLRCTKEHILDIISRAKGQICYWDKNIDMSKATLQVDGKVICRFDNDNQMVIINDNYSDTTKRGEECN